MTNPTLERAARAAWCFNPLERGPFNALQYEYIARAVLMAVREPDEDVISAEAHRQWKKYEWGCAPHDEAFTAMIDAILADGGE